MEGVGLGMALDSPGLGGGVEGMKESPSPSPSAASSTPSPSPSPTTPDHHQSASGGSVVVGGHELVGSAPPSQLPVRMMGMTGISSNSSQNVASLKHGDHVREQGSMALSLAVTSPSPSPALNIAAITSSSGFNMLSSSSLPHKRGRGRPPGSGTRQLLSTLGEWFSYTAGGNFTPHVVTVAAGEDVAARIMSFSQKGPRAICILSANGAISNVTLRQPGSFGGTLTYEGRFEILSLSGSFSISEDSGGVRSRRTGGISVSLAGPDGRVLGGGVAGLLLAATPIQVIVGSFLPNIMKEHKRRCSNGHESWSFSPIPTVLTGGRLLSQTNPVDECVMPTSTTRLPEQPENTRMAKPNSTVSVHRTAVGNWHGLQQSSTTSFLSEHKPSPDINLSLHGQY